MGKKKTLIFLLIVPLLVALISYVGYVVLHRQIRVDLSDIRWSYSPNQGFRIGSDYRLEAEGVYNEDLALAEGNELVWSLPADCEDATIEQRADGYYLIPETEGSAVVTCANAKGTISKSFNAVFYATGAIVINPVNNVSGASVDGQLDYGQFEFVYQGSGAPTKVAATLGLDVQILGDFDNPAIAFDTSDNLAYDEETASLKVLGPGLATVSAHLVDYPSIATTYEFNVIEGGVNVRSYTDLLYCTNWAVTPCPAVLQVNLGSLRDTYVRNEDGTYSQELISENTALFGNYDFTSRSFSFEDEIYTFETTYFTEFIEQYNAARPNGADPISTEVLAGIHLQADLYGNGFYINMSNLAYPNHGKVDQATGKLTPGAEDLFQGPLPFMGLGDLANYPIVSAYGQDNCGIYIDTDGVTIDDVTIRNVDDVDNLYNLTYTGTVLDVEARDVTVQNSILANGKNIVRAFSADGLTIDNCTLRNAAEFLLHAGSNRANTYDDTKTFSYFDGKTSTEVSFEDFFEGTEGATLESAYNSILRGTISDVAGIKRSMESVQEGLDNTAGMIAADGTVNYDAHITVRDTSFDTSGVYSIALDSAFNGGYLYNGAPSMIQTVFDQFQVDILPPNRVGHTSYPVELTLEGDTRFYDFKDIEEADISTLIEENITALLQQIGMLDPSTSVNIDDYFPLKDVIRQQASQRGLLYQADGHDYINTQVAWYGGGVNLSSLVDERESVHLDSSEIYDLDFVTGALEYVPDPSIGSQAGSLIQVLQRAVFMVTGVHPFRTITNGPVTPGQVPPLFGESAPAPAGR